MELTRRPLTLGDAEPLPDLFAAAEAVDRTGEHCTAGDLREEVAGPDVDLALGSTGGRAGERLVCYAVIRRRDSADPVHMPRVESVTRPDFRTADIGAHVTTWVLDAGQRVHERAFPDAPLELHAGVHENERWYADALARAWFGRAADVRGDARGPGRAAAGAAGARGLRAGALRRPLRRADPRRAQRGLRRALGQRRAVDCGVVAPHHRSE
ncbi:hypothetical protein [Amycolatopsis sp. FDAARGOS 1241]|uniref:hypothetical protein n=1 Tax=Amycolatopsis sp. FDAARGOS 1241 TaxID=2778070 RepID=UPI001EF1E222|nr:hypothetical protein [Amycolatopsis sp. FDAARGOS 1241]